MPKKPEEAWIPLWPRGGIFLPELYWHFKFAIEHKRDSPVRVKDHSEETGREFSTFKLNPSIPETEYIPFVTLLFTRHKGHKERRHVDLFITTDKKSVTMPLDKGAKKAIEAYQRLCEGLQRSLEYPLSNDAFTRHAMGAVVAAPDPDPGEENTEEPTASTSSDEPKTTYHQHSKPEDQAHGGIVSYIDFQKKTGSGDDEDEKADKNPSSKVDGNTETASDAKKPKKKKNKKKKKKGKKADNGHASNHEEVSSQPSEVGVSDNSKVTSNMKTTSMAKKGKKPTEPPANPRDHIDWSYFKTRVQAMIIHKGERGFHPSHDPPDPKQHRDPCPCCPTRLIVKGLPLRGNPQQKVTDESPLCNVDDFRPTFEHDSEVTTHCSIHECQRCFLAYMGYHEMGELESLALSGPVIKHIPLAYALLTPAKDGKFPCLGDICETVSYALTYLFEPTTRHMLPNNFDDIDAYYLVDPLDTSPAEIASLAEAPAMKNNKTRAELLASLVLSCFADLMDAELMTQDKYDDIYSPYADSLEDNNPWGESLFYVPMTDITDIKWPFWGPIPNACRCENPDCTSGEHDVEVYHRVLSLLRWTVKEMADTGRYYASKTGLGRMYRGKYQGDGLMHRTSGLLCRTTAQLSSIAAPTVRKTPALKGDERATFLEMQKEKFMKEAREMAVEIFTDQIRAARLLAVSPAATLLRPAVMPDAATNTHDDPFPTDGTDKEKEAWITRFEAYLWEALEKDGFRKEAHPDLHQEIRWFARFRARGEFSYTAPLSDEERRVAEAEARDYLSDASLCFINQSDRQAMEMRDMRVIVALGQLKKDGCDFLHIPKDLTDEQYEQWCLIMLQPVISIFQLGGMAANEIHYMLKPLTTFVFFSWWAVRQENILLSRDNPTQQEIDVWGEHLSTAATSRVEIEVFFKHRLSEKVRKIMLEGVIEACCPGDDWLAGKSPVGNPFADSKKLEGSTMRGIF